MNEVTLHRGRSPHLNIVDAYVDGVHLTEAFASHFPILCISYFDLNKVRRFDYRNTDRVNGILIVLRRSYRAPFRKSPSLDSHLSPKPLFQAPSFPRNKSSHSPGRYKPPTIHCTRSLMVDQPQIPCTCQCVHGRSRTLVTHQIVTSRRVCPRANVAIPHSVRPTIVAVPRTRTRTRIP